MQLKLPERLPPWLVAVITLLGIAALSITFSLVDVDGDGAPDRIDITVQTEKVSTPANVSPGDGLPATTVTAPAPLVKKAAATVESDLRTLPDEIPDDRAAEIREDVQAAADRNRAATDPLPTAGAVQGFAGCVTRILPTNWSSRSGVRPLWNQKHYTVSFNRPGWSDMWAIWTYFAQSGTKASSNFIIDAEGHCIYAVPIEGMAWTSAGANKFAISTEVIAYGNESDYLEPAGWAKMRLVDRQLRDRVGIPLRRGSVNPSSPCTPGRSGIVQHVDHGLCGGGHHDIRPFSIDEVVRKMFAPSSRLTKYERQLKRKRCGARAAVIEAAKGSAARRARLRTSRIHRQAVRNEMRRLSRAHARGRSWSYHHIGARRQELARVWTGRGC
jgi:N-acetylmuramoyl-L-alanine amidase